MSRLRSADDIRLSDLVNMIKLQNNIQEMEMFYLCEER